MVCLTFFFDIGGVVVVVVVSWESVIRLTVRILVFRHGRGSDLVFFWRWKSRQRCLLVCHALLVLHRCDQ